MCSDSTSKALLECHCAACQFTKCCYAEYHHAKCQILQCKRSHLYSSSLTLDGFRKAKQKCLLLKKDKSSQNYFDLQINLLKIVLKLLSYRLINYFINFHSKQVFARCHGCPLSNLRSLQVQQLQLGVQLHPDGQGH
jgi:hypothetical protein